jgi:hypothetical protein
MTAGYKHQTPISCEAPMRVAIIAVLLAVHSLLAQVDTISDTVSSTGVPAPIAPAPLPPASVPAPVAIATPTGSLQIIAATTGTKIFLDGKLVGVSECIVEKVPVGPHNVLFIDSDKSTAMDGLTVEGVMRTIRQQPERETYMNVMSTFSNVWCRGVRAFGPSLDLGVQHKKSYYGINFHWGFFNDPYWNPPDADSKGQGTIIGGAGLQWYYTVFTYKDYLEIAPGIASGFWYFSGTRYNSQPAPNSMYPNDNNTYFNEMFFTGPSLRLCVGFKHFFLTTAYTMLIGTHVGHALVFGARVVL